MMILLSIMFWLALLAGVLVLLFMLFGKLYRVEPKPDSIVFVTTKDDWRLALTRYCPKKPIRGAPPVLLCAGGGMNGLIFDVSKGTSLARFLSRHGYDVWVVDLRGRGLPNLLGSWSRRRSNWSFDDYVDFDLPAVVEEVCGQTGASEVQWVGFGLGALVACAGMGGPVAVRLRSVVSLGAAAFFGQQQGVISPRLLRSLRWVRVDRLLRILAPLLGRWYPPPIKYLQNRDNIDGDVYRNAVVNATSALSRTELNQYAEWLEHDTFTAIVNRKDCRVSLAESTTPVMWVVGTRDQLAPLDMVEATSKLMDESGDNKVVVASRMHGMSTNYGHLDLLLGRGVQRDIHPHVLSWLDDHAGVDLDGVDERPAPPTPRDRYEPPRSRARQRYDEEDLHGGDDVEEEEEEELVTGDVPHVPR